MKTIFRLNILLLSGMILFACSEAKQSQGKAPDGPLEDRLDYINNPKNFSGEGERLNALFSAYTEWEKSSSPINSTYLGDVRFNHLWDDLSPEGLRKSTAQLKLFAETEDWFDTKNLSEQEQLNLVIFLRVVKGNYELKATYPEQYLLIDQIGGIHQVIPSILQMMPNQRKEDFENLIARLKGIPELLNGVQSSLKEGIEKGIVMPRNTVIEVPNQLKTLIAENPSQSVFYAPFENLKEKISLEGKESYNNEAREIILKEVNPSLVQFTQFMNETYLPNSRETFGLSDLPNGEAWYDERIKHNTTTDMTAAQIHQLGIEEVARIKEEMLQIIEELNFKGDFDAFNEFLRTDPQFFYTTPEELLVAYRDICKRIDPLLTKLFGHLPRLPYGVKEVPAYSEQSTTTAYYQPGSPKGGVPGYFFANTYNLKSRPKWEMEALSIHEAVPGHHLQLSIAQELENVPEFRTSLGFTAFVEGWGLYSESLGPELGMYTNPYSRYGQLTYEMWRAVRLVVDTGIHQFGWTRQQAIDYFKANSSKSEHDITVEIDRYIAWPGQALAYKIGELKIKALRQRAQLALGDEFDIREFHDQVLGNGTIPLDVLEDQIDQWLEKYNNMNN